MGLNEGRILGKGFFKKRGRPLRPFQLGQHICVSNPEPDLFGRFPDRRLVGFQPFRNGMIFPEHLEGFQLEDGRFQQLFPFFFFRRQENVHQKSLQRPLGRFRPLHLSRVSAVQAGVFLAREKGLLRILKQEHPIHVVFVFRAARGTSQKLAEVGDGKQAPRVMVEKGLVDAPLPGVRLKDGFPGVVQLGKFPSQQFGQQDKCPVDVGLPFPGLGPDSFQTGLGNGVLDEFQHPPPVQLPKDLPMFRGKGFDRGRRHGE